MKTTVRIPDGLAMQAQQRAEWLGLSLNALVAVALDAYLGQDRDRGGVVSVPHVPGAHVESSGAGDGLQGLTRQQRRQAERLQAKGKGGAA